MGVWLGTAPGLGLRKNTPPGKQPQGRELNEIGGSLYKRWGMWFNSTVHGQPYQPPLLASADHSTLLRNASTQALHGCRQFVLWDVALSCQTNAIRLAHRSPWPPSLRGRGSSLFASLVRSSRGARRASARATNLRKKSSQYGLYRLGYARATRAATTGRYGETQREPPKPASVRIAPCNSGA